MIISSLKALPQLKVLEINENPICQSTILNDFIIYRFPKIERINEIHIETLEIDENRKKARFLFENFDKILQIPEKMPNPEFFLQKIEELMKKPQNSNKTSIKQVNRLITEGSQSFLSQVLTEIHEEITIKNQFEENWDLYVQDLIKLI